MKTQINASKIYSFTSSLNYIIYPDHSHSSAPYLSSLETLYDFRLYTGESHIPNSGFGAFLTFEGARLLKPEAAKRSKQLMKDRYPIDVPTARFLEAKGIDGMNVSVSLKGDNLHGNGNNPYFRVTRFPLKATLQNGKRVQVTIGPEKIHEDIDLLRKNNEIPSHTDGFGHFKITTKDDYTESEEDFCSHSDGCGLIDIGRYGPFLHSGKKHYSIGLLFDGFGSLLFDAYSMVHEPIY